MNFQCDQQVLGDVIAYISRYSTKITTRREEQLLYLAVDDGILILKGTSGAIYSIVSAPVEMKEAGEALVDGALITSIVSTLSPGDITVSGKKRLTLKQGKATRRVSTGIAEDFPLAPKVRSDSDIVVDAGVLVEAFSRVDFARSMTMVTPVLRGYYMDFDGLGMVAATDSQRMAYHTLGKGEGQLVFPAEGAEALSRALKLCPTDNVRIQATDLGWTLLTLTNGIIDVLIYVAGIAGNYPTQVLGLVDKLINSEEDATCLSISKDVLLPSVKMANVLSEVAGKASGEQSLRIIVDSDITLEMKTSEGDMCDKIDGKVIGNPISILVSPGHLLQILQTAPEDQIDIKIWSPFQPLLFTSGESWIVVQAPLGDREAVEQWEQQRQVVDDTGDF